MEKYFKQFENCRQKEDPTCTNICPFKFDVKDFLDKVGRNKYDRAYKAYRDAVVFPEIVSQLCDAPCQNVCPRKDYDGSVQIKLLEKTCIAKAKKKEPQKFTLPKKEGRIGIIGAGLSGLACALRLASKKYDVIIFEKEDNPGGALSEFLNEDDYLQAINLQMSKEEYQLITGNEITDLKQLDEFDFDALYIATGKDGKNFGYPDGFTEGFVGKPSVWTGGCLVGKNVITAIVDGIDVAAAIDLYLKTGKGEIARTSQTTKVVPNLKKIIKCEPVIPTDGGLFTDDEVSREAARCISCQCDACWTSCDMVDYFNKWPSKMREEVVETVFESGSMLRKSPAVYLANSCTQCGLFEEKCPAGIDMKSMMLQTRKILHKQQQMPPAFHGFWMDDMAHANGGSASVTRNAPGTMSSEYALFPGCNLGASQPEYVNRIYDWLNEHFDNIGIILKCCGIHAEWAGDEKLTEELKESLLDDWKTLGKPIFITVCPSCIRYIRDAIPEVKCISLYEFMLEKEVFPKSCHSGINKGTYAIFDPCASRNNMDMQEAVREIMGSCGIETVELEQKGEYGCCGFGGDIGIASPEFAEYIVNKRSAMTDMPYITYCINCRDMFVDNNKPAKHVLDILFGVEEKIKNTPDHTERRRNRELLKRQLLETYWGEQMMGTVDNYDFEIVCRDEIRNKMKQLHLVEDDIKEVISRSNTLKRRTYNEATGEYTCYSKLNYITCWVRYVIKDDRYVLTNVYTHRMDIKLEDVWNGRKVKTDL